MAGAGPVLPTPCLRLGFRQPPGLGCRLLALLSPCAVQIYATCPRAQHVSPLPTVKRGFFHDERNLL